MEAFDSLSGSHSGSSKKRKTSKSSNGHHKQKTQTDDITPLLMKSFASDPSVPIIDYSKIATKLPDPPSELGNPFSQEVDVPTPGDRSKRRASISMHRGLGSDSEAPVSPHRRTESSSGEKVSPSKPEGEGNRSRSSSITGGSRMNRSPSTPTVGSNGKKTVHEAQLSTNFKPGIPTGLSPRSQALSIERPENVPELTSDTSDSKFSKRNVYFNLAAQIQAAAGSAQDEILATLDEKFKQQESFIRAINQRQQIMMAALSDLSMKRIIKLDQRGQYAGSIEPAPEECCSCGCFSFCASFFDSA